jgi:hypothetical protein
MLHHMLLRLGAVRVSSLGSDSRLSTCRSEQIKKIQTSLLYRLQHLLRKHTPALADSIVLEQGKTLAGLFQLSSCYVLANQTPFSDAQGDIYRGLQVVETAIGITSNLLGDHIQGNRHVSSLSEPSLICPQSAKTWIPTHGECHLACVRGKRVDVSCLWCNAYHQFSVAPFNFPA